MSENVPPSPDPLVLSLIRGQVGDLIGRAGLRPQDGDDLQQHLTLELLRRLGRAALRSPPPCPLLGVVLRRIAANYLRDRRTPKRDWRRRQSLIPPDEYPAGPPDDPATLLEDSVHEARRGPPARSTEERRDLALDVAAFLARLPPDLRALAEALMTDSKSAAARRRGVPRTTLQRDLQRLLRRSEQAGLRTYL